MDADLAPPTTRVRVLALVAAAIVLCGLVVLAGLIGPWTAVPRTATLEAPPADPVTIPPIESIAGPTAGAAEPPVDSWPTVRLIALVLAGLVLLALAVFAVAHLRNRTRWLERAAVPDRPAPVLPPVEPPPAPPEARTFDAREAADYVIACWERVEQAGHAVGSRRRPEQTPTEFLEALVSVRPVDPTAAAALLRLYQKARFDHHALAPDTVAQAGTALRTVLAGLDRAGAVPTE